MNLDKKDLENRFFYRLIKVLYFLFMGFSLIFIFIAMIASRPTRIIDQETSYLACDNGNYYRLSTVKIHTDQEILDVYDDEYASEVCSNKRKVSPDKIPSSIRIKKKSGGLFPGENPPEQQGKNLFPEYRVNKNYLISLSYKTDGSAWWFLITFWALGSAFIYIVLNIIQETLLYLAFGKKFSWPLTFIFVKMIKLVWLKKK